MGRSRLFSVDSLSGIYVLVVDAEKDQRALLTGILRYCGALVTAVETPEGAVAVMEILRPDVLVVDFSSEAPAGLLVLERARAHDDEHRSIAAVAVGESALRRLARRRGFDAYVERPFDPWELCRVISDLLTA